MKNGSFNSKLGIRAKLIIYFSLLFIFIFSIMQVVEIVGIPGTRLTGSIGQQREEAFASLNLIADLKKDRLEDWLKDRFNDLDSIFNNKLVKTNLNLVHSDVHQLLDAGASYDEIWEVSPSRENYFNLLDFIDVEKPSFSTYHKVSLLDSSEGMVLFSTDSNDLGLTFDQTPGVNENVVVGTFSISDVMLSPENGQPTLYISWMIPADYGSEHLLLVLEVNVDEIFAPMLHTGEGLGERGEALLVNKSVEILTSLKHKLPDGSDAQPLRFKINAKPAVLAAVGHEGIIETEDYRGVPVLAAYRHIPISTETGWGLVVKRDRDEVFAPIRQNIIYAAVIGIIGIIAAILLITALASRITTPIMKLSRLAERVSGGELDVVTEVASTDEVGVLAAAFNAMLQNIRKWQEELEAKVDARTIELKDVNEELLAEITQRKLVEMSLKESHDLINAVIEGSQDAIFVKDVESRYLLVNKAILRIFNIKAVDLLGKDDYALFSPEDADRMRADDREIIESGKAKTFEETTHVGSDKITWHTTKVPFTDSEGNIKGIIGISRNISSLKAAEEERRQLEAKVLHAQKLESLGVLAGGIAHDFNNLLVAILGNSDIMMLELPKTSPARAHLKEVIKASHRAADLCKQMLAYSGKGKFVIDRIDVSNTVREITEMLEVSISKKSTLKFNLADDLPKIEADGTQIRQVFMNLITNASEASDSKQVLITVTTSSMYCDREYLEGMDIGKDLPEAVYVFVEVSDNGSGMDPETQRKIFEPFFTTKFTGRGLGLAAVLGIVRGHNGAIKIYSEPGKGTTIKVLFPVSDGESVESKVMETPVTDNSGSWRGKGTVLLVDDEEIIQRLGKSMLGRLGFDVITASDGVSALETFREHSDEIVGVILDMTMPIMDGEETFRELRKIDPDVKVILTSGYHEQDVTSRFSGKGLSGFLQKPYLFTDFKDLLRNVLGNDKSVS